MDRNTIIALFMVMYADGDDYDDDDDDDDSKVVTSFHNSSLTYWYQGLSS